MPPKKDYQVKITIDCDAEGRSDSQIANFIISATDGDYAFYVEYVLMPYTQVDTLAYHLFWIQESVRRQTNRYWDFQVKFYQEPQTPTILNSSGIPQPQPGKPQPNLGGKRDLPTEILLPVFVIEINQVEECDCGVIGTRIHLFSSSTILKKPTSQPVEFPYGSLHQTRGVFEFPSHTEEAWPIFSVVNLLNYSKHKSEWRWTPIKPSLSDIFKSLTGAPTSVVKIKEEVPVTSSGRTVMKSIERPTSEPTDSSNQRRRYVPGDPKTEDDMDRERKYGTDAAEALSAWKSFLEKLKEARAPQGSSQRTLRSIWEYPFKWPLPSGGGG